MSIFEETGGGLGAVAHDRSLELFFDRFEVIARFVALINEDPAPRRVLYLHGLGGNGKSLLLRYLAARCCVRLLPSEWERVRRLPDAELPAALAGAAKAARVPVARIDFGARPVGENRPQEWVVLLFDTHEAFFGEAIADPQALLHADLLMRDEWLRSLLRHLPLEAGWWPWARGRCIRTSWGCARTWPWPLSGAEKACARNSWVEHHPPRARRMLLQGTPGSHPC